MAGANYMGGKKHKAQVRVNDTTRRAHRRHFSTQKLLAAGRGLAKSSATDHDQTLECIQLAHARRNPSNNDTGYIPMPIRVSPCTPTSKSRLSQLSDSNSSSTSKVLQALDTSEPFFLRAAMDKIVLMPDLAGLSKRPSRNLKRQQSSSSPCAREETRKRHKTTESVSRHHASPHARPSSGSSIGAQVSDKGFSGHHSYSNLEAGAAIPPPIFDVPEEEGFEDSYSSDANNSATWTVYPSTKTVLPKTRHGSSPSSRDLERSPSLKPVQPVHNGLHILTGNGSPSVSSQINLFDYEDPWKALGIMLGVEKTPHTPLKTRDIRKVLAGIPTPLPTPTMDDASFLLHDNYYPQPHQSYYSRLPNLRGSRNSEPETFQIFSPPTRSQPILPNVLQSLLPYSSEASSRAHSSPSHYAHGTRLERGPALSPGPDRKLQEERDDEGFGVRLFEDAQADPVSTPRRPTFNLVQRQQQDVGSSEIDAIEELEYYVQVDTAVDFDPHLIPSAIDPSGRQSSSPLLRYSTSSYNQREVCQQHDQQGFYVYHSDMHDYAIGVGHRSSPMNAVIQMNKHIPEPKEEAFLDAMRFARPSSDSPRELDSDYNHDYDKIIDGPTLAEIPLTHPRTPNAKHTLPDNNDDDAQGLITSTVQHIAAPHRLISTAAPNSASGSTPPQRVPEAKPNAVSDSGLTRNNVYRLPQRFSSPVMHASDTFQSPQLFVLSKHSPDFNSNRRLDPRTKLSTRLDTSLRPRAPSARLRSPVSHKTTPTIEKLLSQTAQTRTPTLSPLNPRSTTNNSIQSLRNRFADLPRSSPSAGDQNPKEPESDLSCHVPSPSAHTFLQQTQTQTLPIHSSFLSSKTSVAHSEENDSDMLRNPHSVVTGNERELPMAASSREKVLLSLFEDDDVESDSD